MLRLAYFVFLAWLLQLPSFGVITVEPWTPIYKGIDFAKGTADTNETRLQKVFAFRVDLADPDVEFFSTPSNGAEPLETISQTTSQFLNSHGLQIAVNANFFSPCCSGPEPKDVLGLAMSRGEVVSPQVTSGTGSDVVAITRFNQGLITNTASPLNLSNYWTAVAGSPWMVKNGVNTGGDPNAHPRTAVGISKDSRYLFMVVIDGRQPGWSDGATMTETGDWLIRFGAWQGLNLDGGGSTAMVKQESGTATTLNRPSGGVQRQNGNNFGVFAPLLAPGISAQPQSRTILEGDTITLTVGSYGTTPLRYQWRFNGTDISRATGASYSITNAQMSHAGTYEVVITNSVGTSVSSPAMLAVNYALLTNSTLGGVISKVPGTPNHSPGSTVTLTALPDPGFVFTGWSGDAVGSANPVSLFMDGHKTVTASFSGFPSDIVMDNPQATFAGTWTTATTALDKFGTNYRTASTLSSKSATYRPTIYTPGRYAVYTWYPTELTRSTNAPWTVSHANGTDLTRINQNTGGGRWNLLFTGREFVRGTAGTVVLSNTTDARVIADAVRFVYGFPPRITAQPNSLTVVSGQSASFHVAAEGTQPITYQWHLDEVPVFNGTNSTLIINDARSSHAGIYTASVSNLFGAVISTPVSLVVNLPPSITTQPQSQSVGQGANVTFAVLANGTAPLFYQWRLNNIPIPGAATSSYSLTNIQTTDAGDYSVLVTNVAGNTLSSNAVLSVSATPVAPAITSQPQSGIVIAGRTLVLQASANGTLPMLYRWLFNGAPIKQAASATLTIPNVQPANAGDYQFVAGNHVGSVTSAVASVSVHFLLSALPNLGGAISKSPEAPGYTPGTSVTLSAIPDATFAFSGWTGALSSTNNPVTITMNSNVILRAHFSGGVPDLVIDNPAASYTGAWTIGTTAAGRYGADYHFATSAGTVTATANYGRDFTTAGKYNVYIWYPAGSNRASDAPWETVSEVTTNLTLVDQMSGGGTWYLISSNHEFLRGTNAFVRLSNKANNSVVIADAVRFAFVLPPNISLHPQSRFLPAGTNVTFSVGTTSPPLSYQWYFNDAPIPGAQTSAYSISNLQPADSGSYSVAVSNAGGTVFSSPAFLTVFVPVSIPARFEMVTLETTSIRLRISGAPDSIYAIEVSSNLFEWSFITNINSGPGVFEYTDENLDQAQRFYRAYQSD